jgi:hypothetical protein
MDELYRYEEKVYTPGIEVFDELFSAPDVWVLLQEHKVTGTTPKGVWIDYFGIKKFVALTSFIARKTRQLRILKAQTANIEVALSQAKKIELKNET